MRIINSITDRFVTCFGMLLIAAVVASPVACTMSRHEKITRAIEAGADPLAAKCAIESENGSSALCMAVAVNGADPITARCATIANGSTDPVCMAIASKKEKD